MINRGNALSLKRTTSKDPDMFSSHRCKHSRPATITAMAVSILTLFAAANAQAQDYPARPITLVVPFPPGGGNDAMARIVGDKLGEVLGQRLIIENKGGAGGVLGTTSVARAAPDGYTLLLGHTGTLGINPYLYKNVTYDPRKDFAPAGLVARIPLVMVVNPSLPANSVSEFISHAKERPGQLNYASSGVGTGSHLAAELFASRAGIKMTHVPYRGTAPSITDLIGGRVDVSFSVASSVASQVEGGNLRALAVTSAMRSPTLPSVPTTAEAGLPGFEAVLNYGILAPAGTPIEIIKLLNTKLQAVLTSDDMKKRLVADGAEAAPSSPDEYSALIADDLNKWGEAVRSSGAKLD
jgi:tripartite-type tricarboxylate transporter receptor subunit TctC